LSIGKRAALAGLAFALSASGALAQSSDFVETPIGATPAVTASPLPQTPKPGAPKPAATPAATADGATAVPGARADSDFVEQPVGDAGAAQPANGAAAPSGVTPFGFLSNIQRSSSALGDMWGLRPTLAKFGTTLTVLEQSELLGNVAGGVHQGFVYEGLTTATLQTDTQRAFGLYGGLFNVSALQYHGGNLSAQNLDTLQTASGIEADRATRLWELWYQQKLFDDRVDIKIGQQSLDQEFMVTSNGAYFVNTMFGWPMLPSADMPGGGPAYPLSALGIRARVHLNDYFTLYAGLFNGSPVSNNTGDPQMRNPSGTSFPLGQGVLAIAELQYAYPGPNTLVQAGEPDPLSRTYKIGMWYDSESFADLRYDTAGQSLASATTNGNPLMHNGDYAFYAVADQMIYRWADDPDRNINVFVRPMFTPLQDRNLISFSLNAGLVIHEPFLGRDDDTFGLGMGYAQVSSGASAYDRSYAAYNPGAFAPVRSGETYFEATYQYEPMPWLQIQPDAQYVLNPGAGVANPNEPGTKVHNEIVIGVRVNAQL
jgi:porin